MPDHVQVPSGLRSLGEPTRTSVYRNVKGEAAFAVIRWDTPTGKETRPVIWDGESFRSCSYGPNRPLYNSDLIAHDEEATILLVEGEKTAEVGVQYVPDGWIVTTWAGGTGAIRYSDWSVLHGRRVVIWPDNDTLGHEAAERIAENLRENGSAVGVVRVSKNYPDKWDLADDLPAGVNPVMVMANLIATAENASTQAAPPAMAEVPPSADEEDDIPIPLAVEEGAEFRALGYDDKSFYVMPSSTRNIVKLTARELMSAPGCLQVVNDFDYWADLFPAKRGSSSRADWEMAGSMIMRQCQAVGVFDPRRLRGRGVWVDEGRVVVHTGERVVVDGRPMNPVMLKSRFIYKMDSPLFVDGVDLDSPATDSDGRMVVELCNTARWERPVFGDLLAGYIATSLVCGGLKWRTHVWVTGNSGSGKSTVINDIVSACVGDVALYPLGETTESGIRQTVGNDALPVIFDEMEGTDEKGPAGAHRRNAIVSLMRMASSEGRGRIMKGSAQHQAVSFTMRSSFLVASIGMSLKEAPDLTRTMVLGLKPMMSDARPTEKQAAQEQWEAMNRLTAMLPDDMPSRLFARMTALLPVILKNAATFREVIAEYMGNRRLGDQVGTLLAGRFALTSKKVVTREQCLEYLQRHDWEGVVATQSDREDVALISHMRQFLMRVQSKNGHYVDRTIGELITLALGRVVDLEVENGKAYDALLRFGIKVDEGHGLIWVAKRMAPLDKVMANSTNPTDWTSVIARYPKAVKVSPMIKFAGSTSRAIGLPVEAWED